MEALGMTANQARQIYGTKILGEYDTARTASLMGEQYCCNVYMSTDGVFFLILNKEK
jgi:hypothetical protein